MTGVYASLIVGIGANVGIIIGFALMIFMRWWYDEDSIALCLRFFLRLRGLSIRLKVLPNGIIHFVNDRPGLCSELYQSVLRDDRISSKHGEQLPDKLSDFFGADKVASEDELAEIVKRAVSIFCSSDSFGETVNEFVRREFGRCPRYLLVKLELHKEYLMLKAFSSESLIPEVIHHYCARECQAYRKKRRASRYQGRKYFGGNVHSTSIPQNGGAA